MKTPDVKSALRMRFCSPEWAIFFEVADGTGMNQRRWADAVAMNMYPSRGMEIHGFEIKVSRGDWLRELKNPEKSSTVQQYCDRWWIVAPKELIKPGELPPTWGHYDVTPAGIIRQMVAAPKLESISVNKSFMAAMLRRAGGVDEAVVGAAIQREREILEERFQDRVQHEIDIRAHKANSALEKVAEFERETGLSLNGYGAIKEIADAVRFIRHTGALGTWRGLEGMALEAEKFAAKVREFTSSNTAPANNGDLINTEGE
ncbi:hypothetical protein ACCX84_03590 [Pantoea trifolii]|uniref:hypothetical protein n=1 Tax=Pantoea trifolii TaxID=2968030 RepID=UPI003ED91912